MVSDGLKLVVAYIQPFQLEAVVDALRALPGLPGMTVSEAHGFGAHLAHPPHAGESPEVQPLKPKLRLEIACPATAVAGIVELLRANARTGHPGDGKIVVLALENAVRVRTGERGVDALLARRET
jgi:nitrogen regulatory protein PII